MGNSKSTIQPSDLESETDAHQPQGGYRTHISNGVLIHAAARKRKQPKESSTSEPVEERRSPVNTKSPEATVPADAVETPQPKMDSIKATYKLQLIDSKIPWVVQQSDVVEKVEEFITALKPDPVIEWITKVGETSEKLEGHCITKRCVGSTFQELGINVDVRPVLYDPFIDKSSPCFIEEIELYACLQESDYKACQELIKKYNTCSMNENVKKAKSNM